MADAQPNSARLVLERSVTVRNIDGLHANLLAVLAQQNGVIVDCAALEETDASLIQLLLAARRTARESGKDLSLAAPATGALHATLCQGGFLAGAAADSDGLWFGPPATQVVA